jgi:outer membrane protein OmpA-like peptidoglycan-associated protein
MKELSLLALPLAAALALPALAQSTPQAPPPDSQQQVSQPAAPASQSVNSQQNLQSQPPAQPATSANGASGKEPLKVETREGFWGHLNPFARKKYVQRQLQPVRDRVNELDGLTAENTKMIKDVDARATEGIRVATLKADTADQHAVDAGNRADLAQQTATQATQHLTTVETAVDNVDQYKTATEIEIRFRPGQTVLSKRAKDALDEIADAANGQKGYIIEVQGFSSGSGSAAVENSQRMAQSVVRYFVINHEVPVFRVFTVGMGNARVTAEDGSVRRTRGGRVEVRLMKNGISDLPNSASAVQPGSMGSRSQGGVAGSMQARAKSAPPTPQSSSAATPANDLPQPPQ